MLYILDGVRAARQAAEELAAWQAWQTAALSRTDARRFPRTLAEILPRRKDRTAPQDWREQKQVAWLWASASGATIEERKR